MIPSIDPTFYAAAMPVFILSAGSLVSMLQSVSEQWNQAQRIFTVLMLSILTAMAFAVYNVDTSASFLQGSLVLEELSHIGVFLILILGLLTVVFFREGYLSDKFSTGEIASIFQMVLVGMIVMVSCEEFITLFIGLEITSIGLYALIGYIDVERSRQEGAIKYLIIGSVGSAIFLFGIGLLFAATGSLHIYEIMDKAPTASNAMWVHGGAIMLLLGLALKLAIVPFHMWAPDAYEAAPTSLMAFMATAAKVVILVVLVRITIGTSVLAAQWVPLLNILAMLTILMGNIYALTQNSLKRMLAYSSIAHSGYMLIGFCASSELHALASQSVLFYTLGYILISIIAFGVLVQFESRSNSNIQLDDLKGVAQQYPYASLALAVAMFSFAGLPPAAGFIGKFFLFHSALTEGLYPLVIVAVIGSAISLYYYLRVVVYLYMKDTDTQRTPIVLSRSPLMAFLIFFAIAGNLLLGTIAPRPALNALRTATQNLVQKL